MCVCVWECVWVCVYVVVAGICSWALSMGKRGAGRAASEAPPNQNNQNFDWVQLVRLCLHDHAVEEDREGQRRRRREEYGSFHCLSIAFFVSNHVVDIDNDIDGIEFDWVTMWLRARRSSTIAARCSLLHSSPCSSRSSISRVRMQSIVCADFDRRPSYTVDRRSGARRAYQSLSKSGTVRWKWSSCPAFLLLSLLDSSWMMILTLSRDTLNCTTRTHTHTYTCTHSQSHLM